MTKVLVIFFLIIWTNSVLAQNLVLNPGFEENTKIPNCQDDILFVPHWKIVKGWTWYFEYFHVKGGKDKNGRSFATPTNWAGYQTPHSGDAYACIYTNKGKQDYTVIQAELSEPLKSGKKYYTEVFISLTNIGFCGIGNFWICLSDKEFPSKVYKTHYYKLQKQAEYNGKVITDTANWTKISDIFCAKGGEKYVAVGTLKEKIITRGSDFGIYYIDDLLVKELPEYCEPEGSHDNVLLKIEVNKPIVLNNIFFETGRYELLSASYAELDELLLYLAEHLSVKIEISGHTDNTGTDTDNQTLSENRARAVAEYLILKGISKERISSKGYGSAKPVAENDSEEGKQKNRRVEFTIIDY